MTSRIAETIAASLAVSQMACQSMLVRDCAAARSARRGGREAEAFELRPASPLRRKARNARASAGSRDALTTMAACSIGG